ncbi:MAG: hypothetical protein ACTSQJ_06220 [Promethearchaeota archaeon]
MKNLNNNIKVKEINNEKLIYKITFKRFNKTSFSIGAFFIFLALFNIPLLFNPEIKKLNIGFIGKPLFFYITTYTLYIFVGIFPFIIGIIIITYAILTSRKIILEFSENGSCQYIKKGIFKSFLSSDIEFNIQNSIQKISIGERDQKLLPWIIFTLMIYIVYLLIDYFNFLYYTFDITYKFYELNLSLKTMLVINIFYIILISSIFILFQKKICRIDTSEEYLKIDYVNFNIEKIKETDIEIPFIEAFFEVKNNIIQIKSKNSEKEKLPDGFPEILKIQTGKECFKHLPLFSILINVSFLSIIILSQIISIFFLGLFTFKIEFFLIIAAFFLLIKTLQRCWYSYQEINFSENYSNLSIKRFNPIFGMTIYYFSNIEKIEQDYIPSKPNYLEYIFFFFPLWEIFIVIVNLFSFPEMFFLNSLLSLFYFVIIVSIFIFIAAEYIFPKSTLCIIPKAQQHNRKKKEKFTVYFPESEKTFFPPFRKAFENKRFLKNSYEGIILILIPVIFGLVWYILIYLEIFPPIYEAIF